MPTRHPAKRSFFKPIPALIITALLGLPASAPVDGLAASVPRATVAVANGQPAGSGISLTVGLTPNGDGSSCGTATSVQVNVGDIVDFCYTATNHSATALAYSTLVDSVDGTILHFAATPIPAEGSYTYHRQIRARTSDVHEATWTARSDYYQYTYDDTQPQHFVDISSPANLVDMNAWGAEVPLDIPFPFAMFGGNPVTRLCVSNQGFIRTEIPDCASQLQSDVIYENFSLPVGEGDYVVFSHGNFIVPYWDLLDNVEGGVYSEVQGQAPNRRLIVQWDRPHVVWWGMTYQPHPTQGRVNFEAILSEDGSIAFQYQKTTFDYVNFLGAPDTSLDDGKSATIGLSAAGANGSNASQYSFNTEMAHPAPSSIIWTPSAPPTIYSAQASVEIDADGPLIEPSPSLIAAGAPSGSSTPVTTTLSVGNGGGRPLDWSIAEGSAPAGYQPPPIRRAAAGETPYAMLQQTAAHAQEGSARSVLDALGIATGDAYAAAPAASQATACGIATPGLIAHDDGVATNAYETLQTSSTFVDKFTPTYYPAIFTSVCVAFNTYAYPVSPAGSVHYEVVVYDDTGPGGSPGNELGSVDATTVGSPLSEGGVFRDSVDISGLGINVVSGSVYIGVRWNPDQASNYSVYLYADENGTDSIPLNAPEGGYFDGGDGVFAPIASTFRNYKSLMVRAVETAPGCTNLQDVPWLSVAPASGSVAPDGSPSNVAITLDPTGLADGTYSANLCLSSAYETAHVPVAFSIGADFPIATLGSDAVSFSLPQGGVGTGAFTIGNAGTAGSLLHYAISEAPGACDAPADVGWLREQPTEGWVRAGESIPINVRADATGMGSGSHTAKLCIATSSASQPLLEVPVTLTLVMPDAIFTNGFESGPNPPAVYDTRDEFLRHVQAGYYEENFNDVPANQTISEPLTYSSGAFSYSIYTQDGAASGLYTWPYVMSHNNSGDQIVVTFTTPVTAVGGNFWESSMYGEEMNGPIWLTLSDGTFVPLGHTSQAESFAGFITASPITSLTIDSPNGAYSWAKLDNLIVGNKN